MRSTRLVFIPAAAVLTLLAACPASNGSGEGEGEGAGEGEGEGQECETDAFVATCDGDLITECVAGTTQVRDCSALTLRAFASDTGPEGFTFGVGGCAQSEQGIAACVGPDTAVGTACGNPFIVVTGFDDAGDFTTSMFCPEGTLCHVDGSAVDGHETGVCLDTPTRADLCTAANTAGGLFCSDATTLVSVDDGAPLVPEGCADNRIVVEDCAGYDAASTCSASDLQCTLPSGAQCSADSIGALECASDRGLCGTDGRICP
jgi:hypothetical protein